MEDGIQKFFIRFLKYLDLTIQTLQITTPMPRRKSPAALSTKQMKRSKPINTSLMRNIEPLTENQEKLWDEYASKVKNLIAYGANGGAGKTFCACL